MRSRSKLEHQELAPLGHARRRCPSSAASSAGVPRTTSDWATLEPGRRARRARHGTRRRGCRGRAARASAHCGASRSAWYHLPALPTGWQRPSAPERRSQSSRPRHGRRRHPAIPPGRVPGRCRVWGRSQPSEETNPLTDQHDETTEANAEASTTSRRGPCAGGRPPEVGSAEAATPRTAAAAEDRPSPRSRRPRHAAEAEAAAADEPARSRPPQAARRRRGTAPAGTQPEPARREASAPTARTARSPPRMSPAVADAPGVEDAPRPRQRRRAAERRGLRRRPRGGPRPSPSRSSSRPTRADHHGRAARRAVGRDPQPQAR